MSEYKDEDVVLVGWPTVAGPPSVPSTQVNCHKCKRPVWVSKGSMNTVLDKKTEMGGKVYITCLMCAPDDQSHELQIGEEQKAELIAEGIDIDDFIRRSGLSLTELAKVVIRKAEFMEDLRSLHRAANPTGCGSLQCSVCNTEKTP